MTLKKLFSAALIASGMAAAGSASAVGIFPEFTINPAVFGGPTTTVTADKITGNYSEIFTFGTTTGSTTPFTVSLLFNAGQFVANDGTTALQSFQTGLGTTYGLYALFQGSGTATTTGSSTTFQLTPGAGQLQLYVDPGVGGLTNASPPNTVFTAPASGSAPYTTTNSADDVLIATGVALMGNGNQNCTGSNNCGSFGQTTSFALTPTGSSFFTSPNPFFNISIQTGQFNGVPVAQGTTSSELNGSLDAVFQTVPEPSSLALFGLALVGFAATRRRKS